ncbi:DUF5819 family protein [Kitasatospora cinereorecta]|uniref:DUF5819 family protein n=1 Tax=Kitasatospora cinereorecta TaxID=285560 RepID=A0ABW0V728_9ACTN
MGRTGPGQVLGGTESVNAMESSRQRADDSITAPGPPRTLAATLVVAVALCLATSVVHVLLVFLYVAPPNQMSQYYSRQINAWIYPLFEQNWRLFAPDPESVTRQISVRTSRTSPDGATQVGEWFDLTAMDDSDVEHNIFPSHTTQNMLRRAWTSYLELQGTDDKPHSARALMLQKYLRNIAVERAAAHQSGAFDAVQVRVITRPIAAPSTPGAPRPTTPAAVDTRYLPWWKVTPNGN